MPVHIIKLRRATLVFFISLLNHEIALLNFIVVHTSVTIAAYRNNGKINAAALKVKCSF